jgi:hypothetical protein
LIDPLSNLNPLSTTVTSKNIKLFSSLSSTSMTRNLVGNFILHNSNRKSDIRFDISQINQLEKDRDVVAQAQAIATLSELPSVPFPVINALTNFIADSKVSANL